MPGSLRANESIHQASNWQKIAPKYNHDRVPWSSYIDKFLSSMGTYPAITDDQAKRGLYCLLEGNVDKLAMGHMNPKHWPNKLLNDYIKRLGNLFQPPGDSDQARLNFLARVQVPCRHISLFRVILYPNDLRLSVQGSSQRVGSWKLL